MDTSLSTIPPYGATSQEPSGEDQWSGGVPDLSDAGIQITKSGRGVIDDIRGVPCAPRRPSAEEAVPEGDPRGCPRPGTLAVRRFAVPGVRIAFASAMSERRIGALFNAVTRRPRSRTPAVTGTTPSRLSHSAPLSVRLTPSTACPRGRTPDDRKPENSACSSDENPHSLGAGFAQVIVISRIRWSRPAPSRALPPPLRFAWPVPGPGRSLPLHRAT